MSSDLPLTWSSFAAIPPIFTTIPDGKQDTEGCGNTAGQDIVIGAPPIAVVIHNYLPAV